MTVKYHTKGFIFKKEDRAEGDKVFSVFTQDYGRLEILGRSIRKINAKLKGGIDLFYISEIEFIQGKHYKTLTDAVAVKKYHALYANPKQFEVAAMISRMLGRVVTGQEKDQAVFNLLKEVFEILNGELLQTKNRQFIYYYFVWNFLALQGYRCQVQTCVACEKPLDEYRLYFSNRQGGLVCASCAAADKSAKKINADVVKILRVIVSKNWPLLSRLKIDLVSEKLLAAISREAAAALYLS